MSSGLLSAQGTDFDDLFQSSGGDQLLYIYANDGQDVGQKYLNVNAGQAISSDTAFYCADGVDVRYKLCAKGTGQIGLFKPNCNSWNGYYNSNSDVNVHLNFWTGYVNTWLANKNNGTMIKVNNVQNDCIYRGVNSSYMYSTILFAFSPGGVAFSYQKIDQQIWHNSWCDTYFVDFTVGSTVRGVLIYCRAGAGGVQTVWSASAVLGGSETVTYEACYGIDNDSNKPVVGDNQNVTFNGKLYTFYYG